MLRRQELLSICERRYIRCLNLDISQVSDCRRSMNEAMPGRSNGGPGKDLLIRELRQTLDREREERTRERQEGDREREKRDTEKNQEVIRMEKWVCSLLLASACARLSLSLCVCVCVFVFSVSS